MGKLEILTIICTFFILSNAISQEFLNLDFEHSVYKAQPRKWAIEGEGDLYYAKLDSTVANSSKKSLYVNLKNSEVYTFLSLPGRLVSGKNIEIEGYIKLKNSDSLLCMLAFRNPDGGKPNVSQPIKGNHNEWIPISHKVSFQDDYSSDRLLLALIAIGTGDFWFDNVKIKINGKEYGNGVPDFREPTKKEIVDLNNSAVPILTLAPDSDLKDLSPLKKLIGNANIIALGENSHGSSSIYKLKLRMVKYMVEKKGFSIFALESPVVEADRINDYVLYGKGTLNDVIKNLTYPSWQTQEMIDIIKWIKSYNNETSEKKVEFKGFDMQNGESALKAVEDYAKANDMVLYTNLAELRKLYDGAVNGKKEWDQVSQKSETILVYLESKKNSVNTNDNEEDFKKIKHYMEVFVQSLYYQHNLETAKSRDEYMADNIDWLVKSNEGRKIIISADNAHVTKASGKMGSFLSSAYGKNYIVFAYTFNKGSYSAYGPKDFYEVHPSYVGTYEYFLSKSRYKNFILDLRLINNIPLLDTNAGFRSIGSRPQETTQFMEIDLRKHFDAIVYIENSEHTVPLSK